MPDEIGGCKVVSEEWAVMYDETDEIIERFAEPAEAELWLKHYGHVVSIRKVYIVLAPEEDA